MNSSRLRFCSHAAARYAVEHWHYSRRMPKSKLVKIGAWEDGRFIGAIIYGVGAGNSTNGKRFGLKERFEVAELVRVALCDHETPTSKLVAISIRMIAKFCPGLKLLTSFADAKQNHVGTIYQASGWLYLGAIDYESVALLNGEYVHVRSLGDRYGTRSIRWLRANVDAGARNLKTGVKHHYVYPLDDHLRTELLKIARPYPKRAASETIDTPADQAGEGGEAPTAALQTSNVKRKHG